MFLEMSLINNEIEQSQNVFDSFVGIFHQIGIKFISPIWQLISGMNSIDTAIYQLLWVAANCIETGDEFMRSITKACLENSQSEPNQKLRPDKFNSMEFACMRRLKTSQAPSCQITYLRMARSST